MDDEEQDAVVHQVSHACLLMSTDQFLFFE